MNYSETAIMKVEGTGHWVSGEIVYFLPYACTMLTLYNVNH